MNNIGMLITKFSGNWITYKIGNYTVALLMKSQKDIGHMKDAWLTSLNIMECVCKGITDDLYHKSKNKF